MKFDINLRYYPTSGHHNLAFIIPPWDPINSNRIWIQEIDPIVMNLLSRVLC